MAQLMTLVSFDEIEPAEKLAERMREAGLTAEIRDDSGEQKWKMFNLSPRAHIQVVGPERDADIAFTKLTEWDKADGALAEAVRCPECGSTRIEYPQFSRRTIMGAWPAALAAAGVIEKDFYCNSCQYTWPAEPPKPEPETDRLNWPKKDGRK